MGLVLANYGYDVMSLLGARATKAKIESEIANLNQVLGPNDTLFIYVSSHGTPPVPTPAPACRRKRSAPSICSASPTRRSTRPSAQAATAGPRRPEAAR